MEAIIAHHLHIKFTIIGILKRVYRKIPLNYICDLNQGLYRGAEALKVMICVGGKLSVDKE